MEIRSPESESEFVAYYELRWRVLRKPWGQPSGSERDELDAAATHVAGYDEAKRLVCVGRLHDVETGVGQVRYMAVEEPMRGRGLGQAVLDELERLAKRQGMTAIRLDARESAVGFYQRNGYVTEGEGHTLFGVVHHSKMRKQFAVSNPEEGV
ncbi:MAG TPA: GNAT family N-acetyltransferase [Verrucomicrobia bacterium]|nr:GNAT family N-acetyltransferase [Verrucomicrobiota bacterium]